MTSRPRRVVVADEGWLNGRTALATVRALGSAGYAPWVTVSGRRTLASSSRWCAGVVPVPADAPGYAAALSAAEHGALLVIPASDAAIATLGLSGADLIDKRVVGQRATAAALPVPRAQEFADREALLAHADALDYPVVVKPAARTTLNSAQTVRADDRRGLSRVVEHQALIVQPFLAGGMKSVAVLVLDGRLVAAAHQRFDRIWPLGSGAATAAVTVDADLELESKVLHLVEGHEGMAQVDFVGDHVVDVNPRMYSSLDHAAAAGVNFPALWCAAITDGLPSDLPVRTRAGVRYRWTDADIRAVWALTRSGELRLSDSLAALAPRRGTVHSIGRWSDLRPLGVRLSQVRGFRP